MLLCDVSVVGGGPAGAAAAITLARAGRDVVLIDKARFPRDKCCGDGLTAGALRRLEALGLRAGSGAAWRPGDDGWGRSPSGRGGGVSAARKAREGAGVAPPTPP